MVRGVAPRQGYDWPHHGVVVYDYALDAVYRIEGVGNCSSLNQIFFIFVFPDFALHCGAFLFLGLLLQELEDKFVR